MTSISLSEKKEAGLPSVMLRAAIMDLWEIVRTAMALLGPLYLGVLVLEARFPVALVPLELLVSLLFDAEPGFYRVRRFYLILQLLVVFSALMVFARTHGPNGLRRIEKQSMRRVGPDRPSPGWKYRVPVGLGATALSLLLVEIMFCTVGLVCIADAF